MSKKAPNYPNEPTNDPSLGATKLYNAMHDRFHERPIVGLADKQKKRYRHIKRKVEKIRGHQQEIFLEQFKQFPDVRRDDSNNENYTQIWDTFQNKDADVTGLVQMLNELSGMIEDVNTQSGE